MSDMGGTWVHIKTGNRYWVEGEVINSTNAQDGQRMVLYRRFLPSGILAQDWYAREITEFEQKFARP